MAVFKIQHITSYEYDREVKESVNEMRILPYRAHEQEVLYQQVDITTHPRVETYVDYWGNVATTFNLLTPHRSLVIESKLIVRTLHPDELQINRLATLNDVIFALSDDLSLLELSRVDKTRQSARIQEISSSLRKESSTLAGLIESASHYVFMNFKYIKGITNTETTVDEILQHMSGVCQDFAHILLQILRAAQIPSRYVSGYICPNKNGMRGEGATHAWVEAWVPGTGWVGIDPTNDVWVTNKHVKLAVGRNFKDCTPVKGTFKGAAFQKLSVFVSVGYEDGMIFQQMNNVAMDHQHEQPAPPPVAQQQ